MEYDMSPADLMPIIYLFFCCVGNNAKIHIFIILEYILIFKLGGNHGE